MSVLNLNQANKLYWGNIEVQRLYKSNQLLYTNEIIVPNDTIIWVNSQNVVSSSNLISQFNALRSVPLIATSEATLINNDINGFPSSSFTSGNNYSFTQQSLNDFSLFAVVNFNSTSQQYLLDGATNMFLGLDNSANTYRIMATYFPTGLTKTQLLNIWHIVEIHRSSGVISLLIDGILQSTLTLATTWIINRLGLGTAGRHFSGKFAELILGNRDFTTDEKSILRNYLITKYNL